MRRALFVTTALVSSAALMACGTTSASNAQSAGARGKTPSDQTLHSAVTSKSPALRVRRIVTGKSHVWDVQQIGPQRFLYTEREGRLWLKDRRGSHPVGFPSDQVWVSGETGLMSLAIDPRFRRTQRFYTCQGGTLSDGSHDVEVHAWRLRRGQAVPRGVLLTGIEATSGRHGGCRLMIQRGTGALMVGTGDAAHGANPENLQSLNGKTLRLNRFTGSPWGSNPFSLAPDLKQRYVFSYGHRNVQGLAQRANGSLWSVEQGTYRDDEVNLLRAGGDYGYNPVPGYNESVPMTDQGLPGQQFDARWSSGPSTIATSGGAWVHGRRWRSLHGTLAVAALKGERVVFLRFGPKGFLQREQVPAELTRYGRLRSVTSLRNGDLLITTDNGGDDGVLRVSAR